MASAAVFVLAGCASMSPEECMVANWAEQGHKDGRNGYAPTRITEHRKACAEVGVVPDGRRYRMGWDEGVLEYCTPANGISQGRAGRPYRNVCPPQLEDEFVYWHQLGTDVYQAQKRVDDLTRDIDQLERKLRKSDNRRERQRLRRELDDTQAHLHAARRDLSRAEMRLR